jgi:hypothetical protein
MTHQLWFCERCLIEGDVKFEPAADIWRVVDAVRIDHKEKSTECYGKYGVTGMRLKAGDTDESWEELKQAARRRASRFSEHAV